MAPQPSRLASEAFRFLDNQTLTAIRFDHLDIAQLAELGEISGDLSLICVGRQIGHIECATRSVLGLQEDLVLFSSVCHLAHIDRVNVVVWVKTSRLPMHGQQSQYQGKLRSSPHVCVCVCMCVCVYVCVFARKR